MIRNLESHKHAVVTGTIRGFNDDVNHICIHTYMAIVFRPNIITMLENTVISTEFLTVSRIII